MLINVKIPTIYGILTFMSRINFVLSSVEHEKSFITSGPVFGVSEQQMCRPACAKLCYSLIGKSFLDWLRANFNFLAKLCM